MDIQIVKYVKQVLQKIYNTFYWIVKHSDPRDNMSYDDKGHTKKTDILEFILFNNKINQINK